MATIWFFRTGSLPSQRATTFCVFEGTDAAATLSDADFVRVTAGNGSVPGYAFEREATVLPVPARSASEPFIDSATTGKFSPPAVAGRSLSTWKLPPFSRCRRVRSQAWAAFGDASVITPTA